MNESNESYPSYDELKRSFFDGSIYKASDDDLRRAILGLTKGAETNEYIRHHYVIMSHAIQSIQLNRVLHELEKRNRRTSKLVIIVAALTFCAAVVQIFVFICRPNDQVASHTDKSKQASVFTDSNVPPSNEETKK